MPIVGSIMTSPPSQEVAGRIADSLRASGVALAAASQLDAFKPEDPRDAPVRHILKRCAEFARACASLGRDNNAVSLSILARATLENLILLLWITVSKENAEELKTAAIAEFARVARINLQSGKARIKNSVTGEDATARFLTEARFKNLPKRRSVESRAEDAGVLDLYNVFYRFMSLDTHGHEAGYEGASAGWDLVVMHMQGIGALTKAIGHAGTLWLLRRTRVDNETLRNILGLG